MGGEVAGGIPFNATDIGCCCDGRAFFGKVGFCKASSAVVF